MKETPGLWQLASALQNELNIRFATVIGPHTPGFNLLYVIATTLDPRYSILLNQEQLRFEGGTHMRGSCHTYINAQFSTTFTLFVFFCFQFTTEAEEQTDAVDPETKTEEEVEPSAKKSKSLFIVYYQRET